MKQYIVITLITLSLQADLRAGNETAPKQGHGKSDTIVISGITPRVLNQTKSWPLLGEILIGLSPYFMEAIQSDRR